MSAEETKHDLPPGCTVMDVADKEWNRRFVEACRWLKTEGDVGVRELAAITGMPPHVVCFAMGMARAEKAKS